MLLIYSILHYLLMPFVLFRLFWRSLTVRAYQERWQERFGFGKPIDSPGPRIWIHAVSVGEVQAAMPLVHALRARYPETFIVITTTTPTGAARVADAFGATVEHRYLPYDLPDCVRRFLDRVTPSLAIILETELWPNILHTCRNRAIPILLVNARLSAKSAAAYRRVGGITHRMLQDISAIAAQGHADANRLIALGADPDRVRVTGSVKFDVKLRASLLEEGQVIRRYWGVNRSVWIAASTHEGEEEQVLDAFRDVRKSVPDCLLVLAPRHPERFAKVGALVRRRGYNTLLRSTLLHSATPSEAPGESGHTPLPRMMADSCTDVDVFIGDTMGELLMLYAASDVAFVGGSLVRVGGHNMLEPAALGLPILFGPWVFNFAQIAQNLRENGAAQQVRDKAELTEVTVAFLQDANLRHSTGDKGKTFVEGNRGALEQIMMLISDFYD
uniref:3-deoxy-D-manno-octulosonic acid transferase n=1 Tax=Candidatus Kentrum sp. FM TaxID=2126340 RepID=A0A450T6L4_9GAMM|nr:MAG: 3-deoxy-D-manno-octulosonic-acid transferase [Candidatus Kentron sp. FM]VFJ62177.1 MAG: 3-deoxy-D-manno-octulosonic-acid transferase [Candidatus Kentron sp. FM]VFK14597.1 MAG: 3-deoxy-D-manno-octulosonic-acid transferase [Candidatus Kentron sp. FM]